MNLKLRLLINFLFFTVITYGQKNTQGVTPAHGQYFSLQKALSTNQDSVLSLFLGNSNLKAFPSEILKFNNLEALSFIDQNIGEIYMFGDSTLLSLHDKKLAGKLLKKHNYPDRVGEVRDFPTRNKNKFSYIPATIIQLKKLNQIMFSRGQISRKQMKKLKRLLPNCEIYVW